jgi:hypothetical protein
MPAGRSIFVLLLGLLPIAVGCQRPLGELPRAAVVEQVGSAQAGSNDPVPLPPAETGPIKIAWDELDVGIQAESVYEPWMMKTSIKVLEGQSVRITGYIHPGLLQKDGIREFVLLRNIDCPYGRQGEAHHVILVELQGDLRIAYTRKPVMVEGVFHVRPYQGPDGSTWALYAMDGTRVEPMDERAAPAPESIHLQEDEAAP